MKNERSIFLLIVFAAVAAAQPASPPLRQNGGAWPTSHVQGIAVDVSGGYIYYSFTTLLAKYDFSGRLIGTLTGWTGHLGDLDFNPRDGRVYGSLEYRENRAFYIAAIDVSRLNQVGVNAAASDVFRTVYLPEVVADYTADLSGDGVFDGDVADTRDHRYGCSGIDGVSFGPEFGRIDGPRYLTVAYGIYAHNARTDNDHQVLLQYDITDWARYERPLTEAAPHRDGPAAVHGKYFVRTGNTNYGVQNLAYDEAQQRWFLGVYKGTKPSFPNYLLFAVEARTPPVLGDLVGVPGPDGQGTARGLLLALAADGLQDAATGIRGWNQKADVGIQPIGQGLFYLCVNSAVRDGQTADLTLSRWTGTPAAPFAPATSGDLALVTVAAPVVTSAPRGVSVNVGSTLALAAAATGYPTPTFQWKKDGNSIAGATADTLLLVNIAASSAGNYSVVVTNTAGSATSGVATVVVTAGLPSRLCNFAVRASLAANQTLFIGFSTTGTKTLLVRGIGPTLAAFGLAGALPDPVLALYNSASAKIDENNDWSASLLPVFADVGAFALVNGSKDAALQRVCTGSYTAQLTGTGAGVVLVEVYDSGGTGKLVNVSARHAVGVDANALIAGFVIDGTAAKTVLVRGVGPKLAEFGVAGALVDPRLEIYNAAGAKIAENDNWNAMLESVARRVGAFDLPLGSRDAALVISLPPGSYTAQIAGVGSATGEAAAEIYEVP